MPPNDPDLTNTPDDRRVTDTGRLRARLLKKEDSRIFEPHELPEKSRPAMFDSDWEPVVVGDVFTTQTVEEAHDEQAVQEHRELAVAAEKTHANDMKILKKFMFAIGGVVLLGLVVVAVVVFKQRQP